MNQNNLNSTKKPSKKRDPNRMLKRSMHGAGNSSRFIGGMFLLGGCLQLFIFFPRISIFFETASDIPSKLSSLGVFIIPIVFMSIGAYLFINWPNKSIEPGDPHTFFPKIEARKQLRAGLFWLLIGLPFSGGLAMFFLNLEDIIPKVVTCFIFMVVFIGTIYQFMQTAKIYQQVGKFGNSKIQINNNAIYLGDRLSLTFKNQAVYKYTDSVEIYLWNIHEAWVIKKRSGKNSQSREGIQLYKTSKRIALEGFQTTFELEIPKNEGAKATDYLGAEPIYWELEICSETAGFDSFFYIEIKS